MMASSSSSSNVSDHLLQDDLPWPSSSSLPFAPTPHSAVIGGNNHQWSQQPPMLNCGDHHHSNELEVLLSAQAHNPSHHASSPLPPHQLSSLLMMQDLGFQWSNYCSSLADTASVSTNNGKQDGQNKIKAEQPFNPRSSSCAGAAMAYNDVVLDGGGGGLPAMAAAAGLDGAVLPSVNISRPPPQQLLKAWPAAPPPLPGDAFEILASSRLCKTLLLSQQGSSVLLHNGMPLLRSEHVPHGPPPTAHPQGPSGDNYRQMGAALVNEADGGNRHWSAEHDAACQKAARPVPSQAPPSALKKPRVESRASTIVPSFKVRKEKLGDRIAALQQLVSPFGKTDTASVLMEAISYIKFLQDQVETLSGPYLKSSRNKKPRTAQWGPSSDANGGEQEETRLDLRSRGLCLVPLSCTSYVTNENGVWAPNFR